MNKQVAQPVIMSKRQQFDDAPIILQGAIQDYLDDHYFNNDIPGITWDYINWWWSPYDSKWGFQMIRIPDPFVKTTWSYVKFWNDTNVDKILHPSADYKGWAPIIEGLYDMIHANIIELSEEFQIQQQDGESTKSLKSKGKRETTSKSSSMGNIAGGSKDNLVRKRKDKAPSGGMVSEVDHSRQRPCKKSCSPTEETNSGE